jgi:hypothetical protein
MVLVKLTGEILWNERKEKVAGDIKRSKKDLLLLS